MRFPFKGILIGLLVGATIFFVPFHFPFFLFFILFFLCARFFFAPWRHNRRWGHHSYQDDITPIDGYDHNRPARDGGPARHFQIQ